MKHLVTLFFILLTAILHAWAQEPLYIVNGEVRSQIQTIPPDLIEDVKMLPADEQTIGRYGPQASHGVMLVTLRQDAPAVFSGGDSFVAYIATQIDWDADEPAARLVLRYTITTDGQLHVDKELESTDARFRRRVLKAIEQAPQWLPASKNGAPVPSTDILHIQLPAGKELYREPEVVYR